MKAIIFSIFLSILMGPVHSYGAAGAAVGEGENPFLDPKWDKQRLIRLPTQKGVGHLYGPSDLRLGSLKGCSKDDREFFKKLYKDHHVGTSVKNAEDVWIRHLQMEEANFLSLRPIYREKEGEVPELLGFVGARQHGDFSLQFLAYWDHTKDKDMALIPLAVLTFMGDVFRKPRDSFKNGIWWSMTEKNTKCQNISTAQFGLQPWVFDTSDPDLEPYYKREGFIYYGVRNIWSAIPGIWKDLGQETIVEFNPSEFEEKKDSIRPTGFLKTIAERADQFTFVDEGEKNAYPLPFQEMYALLIEQYAEALYRGIEKEDINLARLNAFTSHETDA